jgi:hypothetical protein
VEHLNAPTPSRPRRWVVAGVAVLALAGVAAGSIFALGEVRPEPGGSITWDAIGWGQIEAKSFEAPNTFISDLTVGPSGLLAWGESAEHDPARPDEPVITTWLWRSPDGVNWQASAFPSDGVKLFIPGVVAEGDIGLLAHGRVGPADLGQAGVVSGDGGTWAATVPPNALGVTENLVAVGNDFVTMGVEGDRPVAWSSEDGITWSPEQIPAPPGIVRASGLTASTAGVLLSGYLETETDFDALIWRRIADGTWMRLGEADRNFVGPERGATVHRVLPVGGGLLALGSAGAIPDCSLGGVRVAAADGRIADHCPGVPPAAWVSSDGRAWREVDLPRPPGIPRGINVFLDVAEPGLDGVFTLLNERPLEATPRYGVWTTADGERWRRVGDGPPFVDAYAQHVASIPGRLVVIGATGAGTFEVWIGNPPPDDP